MIISPRWHYHVYHCQWSHTLPLPLPLPTQRGRNNGPATTFNIASQSQFLPSHFIFSESWVIDFWTEWFLQESGVFLPPTTVIFARAWCCSCCNNNVLLSLTSLPRERRENSCKMWLASLSWSAPTVVTSAADDPSVSQSRRRPLLGFSFLVESAYKCF